MEYNKAFFEKVFSTERMARYFDKYPSDPSRAILHYKCNLELSESMYVTLSVLEVALRNALSRELHMPKKIRQRKNVSAPLNRFRSFRYRVFHNESICWNITHVREIHAELIQMLEWINKDIPGWIAGSDRFPKVSSDICTALGWHE